MARELFRLTEKLYNTPHLISETSLNQILSYLNDRNTGVIELATGLGREKRERHVQFNEDTKVGVIEVTGPLTYEETMFEALCGGMSYQRMVDEFDQMVEMGMKVLVLDCDSGGGEAYSVFESSQYIRSKAEEKGIKILAYVDGEAASAAYAVASIADEIIVNPMAEVGSIGAVVQLVNINGKHKKEGIEKTYIHAGASKIPFDAEGNFRKEFLQDLQRKVDVLYGQFVSFVAEMRGINEDVVKSTEAKTFLAEEAIELGLADKVMTREEFANYLADQVEEPKKTMSKKFTFMKKDKVQDMKLEDLMAENEGLQAKLAEMEAKLESLSLESSQVRELLAQKEGEVVSMKEQVEALQAEMKAQETAALEAKMAARKEKLLSLTSDEEVEALFESTKALGDNEFAVILTQLEKSKVALESTALFQETGVSGEGEKSLSGTAAILKQKYSK